MTIPWLIGLDLGQVHDPSAIAIMRRHWVTWGDTQQQKFHVRYLERFPLGTPYPDIVKMTKTYAESLPVPSDWGADHPAGPIRPYHLVIDATGVGRPVADMFKEVAVWPTRVTITGGNEATRPEQHEYHVPKRHIISALQVAMQTHRIQLAKGITDAETFISEAMNFQFKLSAKSGEDQYGAWREGTHDDLLLAVALAVWYGEQQPLASSESDTPQFYQGGFGPRFPHLGGGASEQSYAGGFGDSRFGR